MPVFNLKNALCPSHLLQNKKILYPIWDSNSLIFTAYKNSILQRSLVSSS